MSVPSRLEVSFGQYAKSLIDEALAKLPSQFLTACVLRQFVAAFVGEVQELYDAVLDMQRGRTLYAAEAANLDALGRIVGEERAPYQYSDSHWFAFDRMGQAWDSTPWWCRDAPLIRLVAGNLVSFEKTGPMQVGLIVPSTISTTNLLRLTTAINTRRVDDEYAVPYPATLNISGYIVFIPTNFFAFDKSNAQRWDSGRWACKGTI